MPPTLIPHVTRRHRSTPVRRDCRLLFVLFLLLLTVAADPLPLQAADAPVIRVKIRVTHDGLYRVSGTELADAGVDLAQLDPARLALFSRDEPVALWLEDGGDGRLDPDDGLLFFGQGVARHEPDARYTGLNVYWLELDHDQPLSMDTRVAAPVWSAPPVVYTRTVLHLEEDTFYWQPMPDGAGQDHWFWGGRLNPHGSANRQSTTLAATLLSPHPDEAALLRVALKGFTTGAHTSRIAVNDHIVDTQSWSGQQEFVHNVGLPAGLLGEGVNEITITAQASADAVDQFLVNWLEIEYSHRLQAAPEGVTFGLPANDHAVVAGVDDGEHFLLDVTNARMPHLLTSFEVLPNAVEGGHALHFNAATVAADSTARYALVVRQHLRRVHDLALVTSSHWKSPVHGADYILIAHPDLMAGTQRLADHRRAQGLRVVVVPVDELYDEFNHGLFNPLALRNFLAYAHREWQPPAPRFVLLVGDAYQDYRNRLAPYPVNLVPSALVETRLFGQTSSDHHLVDFTSDGSAAMAIGRLPAADAEELALMIDKVLRYETAADGDWSQRLLLVADDGEADFAALSADLRRLFPPAMAVTDILAGDPEWPDPAAAIRAAWSRGTLLVNYAGHGEYFRWGTWQDEPLLDGDDVAQLANGDQLPVVTIGNCLSGYFPGPVPSIGEELLSAAQGGAVAVWAPTGLGLPAGHRVLLNAFYTALFRDDVTTLGDAVDAAKRDLMAHSTAWHDLWLTYALLGDPAMVVRLPPLPPTVTGQFPAPDGTAIPLDTPVTVTFHKRMDPASVTISGLPGPVSAPVWDTTTTRLTVTPDAWQPGTRYTLRVHGSDAGGLPLSPDDRPLEWSFATAADRQPPDIDAALSALAQDETAPITLHFSEAVRPASLVLELTPAWPPRPDAEPGEDAEPGPMVQWTGDFTSVTLVHGGLATGIDYRLSVTVTDVAGNRVDPPVRFSFTPGAPAPIPSLFLPLVVR